MLIRASKRVCSSSPSKAGASGGSGGSGSRSSAITPIEDENSGLRDRRYVLLVHDGEIKFVKQGYEVDRREVMYNDFVLVGPKMDPARVRGIKDAVQSLKRSPTLKPCSSLAAMIAVHSPRLTVP